MRPRLTDLARKLRKDGTDAENKLWYFLRSKQFDNLKFRRQQPIGNYIVDFVCFEKKLITELDGGHHNDDEMMKRDKLREGWLEGQGFTILRFWNTDVLDNIDGVLDELMNKINQSQNPLP